MRELISSPGTRVVLLAALDDSERTGEVIAAAASLARALAGAELHLAHVVDAVDPPRVSVGGSPLAVPGAAALLEQGRRFVRRCLDEARPQCPDRRIVGHVAAGPAWREIVQIAIDVDASLVVVGTRPRGALGQLLLGSVAQTVVQRSPVPVLVAKHGPAPSGDLAPACPGCLERQAASGGRTLFCDAHAAHPTRAHLFVDVDEPR